MTNHSQRRRPMELRGNTQIKAICTGLARRGLHPNHISVCVLFFSLLASFFLIFSLYFTEASPLLYFLSIVCIGLRLLSSLLDGMLAIEMKRKIFDGDLYNELPEIISDLLLFCSVGWILQSEIPLGFSIGLFVSWLSLATAYVRQTGASLLGKPYFMGWMSKLNRMIVLVVGLGCQMILFAFNIKPLFALGTALTIISLGCIQTVLIRLKCIRADLRIRSKAKT